MAARPVCESQLLILGQPPHTNHRLLAAPPVKAPGTVGSLLSPSPRFTASTTTGESQLVSNAHPPSAVADRMASLYSVDYSSTTRRDAIQDAQKMQASIIAECEASGQDPPPYEFSELIGKGSFGRVYKARHTQSDRLVAVKVINIDTGDADPGASTFGDILKEIETLKLLGISGAKNVNTVIDALLLGHCMWMITEYCAGGSVSTLMRPRGRLPEHWIIPILREVAEAIYWTHKQGVIHRDIKCANVLITEQGGVQLCDFGVSAIVTTRCDKRSTFTGSLHWMAPELFNVPVQYGTEVDIWAFGSMAYEAASGWPPNAGFRDINRFGKYLNDNLPQLHGDEYSAGLKDLISCCMVGNPAERPPIDKVQLHTYIHNTSTEYPTASLSRLVDAYKLWEAQGGSRLSLFSPGGAQRDSDSTGKVDTEPEWTFSTMRDFDELPDPDAFDFVLQTYDTTISPNKNPGQSRYRRGPAIQKPPPLPLEKLFDPNTVTDYQSSSRQFYGDFVFPPLPPPSDLPLRDNSNPTPLRESLIDLDAALAESDGAESSDILTSDHHRTLQWKFPTSSPKSDPETRDSDSKTLAPSGPVSAASADPRCSNLSLIDLDASIPRTHGRNSFMTPPPKARDSTFTLIDLDGASYTNCATYPAPISGKFRCWTFLYLGVFCLRAS